MRRWSIEISSFAHKQRRIRVAQGYQAPCERLIDWIGAFTMEENQG
ncbi:MAG: hypothetical protein P0S93_03155 [Candidatus Neptunochlamydia sp.]|nr:hypothetical protein [Candidatus Neptunochlamydia sp.]